MFFKLPFYNRKITFNDIISSLFLRNAEQKILIFLQDYFDSENILLLKSARQGIQLILSSLNFKEKDEVILPYFICSVVSEAVINAGAKPIFCEIEKNGFNIDFESAKKLISPHTRAIIIAHLLGIPAQIDKFVKLCKDNKIILIEDCAHALGSRHKGKLVGLFGDFGVFSFGFGKNLGALGGGCLHSRDRSDFLKIKENYSIFINRSKSTLENYLKLFLIPVVFNKYLYWLFDYFVGKYAIFKNKEKNYDKFNLSMSDLEAKIAFIKLKHYENERETRNRNAVIYQQELKKFFYFSLISNDDYPAYPYLPVFSSKEIFSNLITKNVPIQEGFGRLDDGMGGDYFLLPLNYSIKEIRAIAQNIKNIMNYTN